MGNRLAIIAFLLFTPFLANAQDNTSKEWLALILVAAEEGNQLAQSRICEHFGNISAGNPPEKYVEWCETAVSAGDVGAITSYASRLEYGVFPVKKDEKKALALYQKAAEQGDTWAHTRLGFYYATGTVVQQDEGKSCNHYQVGAKDYPVAQEGLGTCYEDGAPGFSKDIKKAILYYEQAVSGEYIAAWAHYRLGYIYFFGAGIEKNPRLAAYYLIKSASQKSGDLPGAGFFILGLIFEGGEGMEKSEEGAFNMYMEGAKKGHAASQNKVGAKYADGIGTKKDIARALMWFTIAAANDFNDAAENRDKAEKLLKPAEIKRAKKLAKEWLEKHPSN